LQISSLADLSLKARTVWMAIHSELVRRYQVKRQILISYCKRKHCHELRRLYIVPDQKRSIHPLDSFPKPSTPKSHFLPHPPWSLLSLHNGASYLACFFLHHISGPLHPLHPGPFTINPSADTMGTPLPHQVSTAFLGSFAVLPALA
jgi:hypothetical protein